MSDGNGNGNGVKSLAAKGVLEILKGQPFGNVLLAAMLVALGFGVYRGVPWVMEHMDATLDKRDARSESMLKELTATFKESRKEDNDRNSNWFKSIEERHGQRHAEVMKGFDRLESAIRDNKPRGDL